MIYLNCYEQDELDQWYERMEDLAYDEDDDNSDDDDDDDEFIKHTFYPDEY